MGVAERPQCAGSTDPRREVAWLVGELFVAASILGIDVNELDETVGNASDFLQDAH